jgi:Na+/H+ antiporter NhaA
VARAAAGAVDVAVAVGAAFLCGIGFTLSLFVGDVASPGDDQAASAAIGIALPAWASRRRGLVKPVV